VLVRPLNKLREVEEYKIKNIEEMQEELTLAMEDLRAELQSLYVQQETLRNNNSIKNEILGKNYIFYSFNRKNRPNGFKSG